MRAANVALLLLRTATSETEYNIIHFWKETLLQYRFLHDIQQRAIDDHNNVILSLMARSLNDEATDGTSHRPAANIFKIKISK